MHSMNSPRGLTRRRMAMALPLLGSAAWIPSAFAAAPAVAERSSRALMGTQVDMVTHGPDARALQAAMDHAWREMERLTALMTRYSPDSTVSAINRNFPGRGGPGAVWLASPPTVAASAIAG